jgi:hypothetical protein
VPVQNERKQEKKVLAHKTYKDGVLQGVLVAPKTNQSHEVRYVGTPMDLVAVAQFLGLEPVDGSELNANDDSAVMELQDGRGGYATLQPVDRASDLLHTVAEMTTMMRSGDLPDELKRMLRENGIDLPEGNPWD